MSTGATTSTHGFGADGRCSGGAGYGEPYGL